MAQYMSIALKATIVVTKKKIASNNISEETAKEIVGEKFNLNLYDASETDHFLLWKLKQELLSQEIVPFLENVFKFYYNQEEANYRTLIGEIRSRKDYDSLFKLAKNMEYEHFELDNTKFEKVQIPKMAKHIQLDYNYFRLFKGEKLRMDNLDKVMLFLNNTLRKTFSEFQLSQALDIYILDSKT
jgi:hypothetical protein